MGEFDYPNYDVSGIEIWSGRTDGLSRDALRWHQMVDTVDLRSNISVVDSVVFVGFCCDEGVRRNQGRVGAKDAPEALRRVLANLPVHFSDSVMLKDAGDISCIEEDMEQAQAALCDAVFNIMQSGGFPIVLGGGHEVTYGHYQGLRKAVGRAKIGVINIDAHLDIRTTVEGKGNSGTGFYQIAKDCEEADLEFYYLAIGIQEISNTRALFEYAADKDVNVIYANDIQENNIDRIKSIINAFSKQVDHIYLTIDMDAFAAPYAPGVSALAFNGIVPDHTFFSIFSALTHLPNLRTIDIAELNPTYDIDNRTARLGASLLFKLLKERSV